MIKAKEENRDIEIEKLKTAIRLKNEEIEKLESDSIRTREIIDQNDKKKYELDVDMEKLKQGIRLKDETISKLEKELEKHSNDSEGMKFIPDIDTKSKPEQSPDQNSRKENTKERRGDIGTGKIFL